MDRHRDLHPDRHVRRRDHWYGQRRNGRTLQYAALHRDRCHAVRAQRPQDGYHQRCLRISAAQLPDQVREARYRNAQGGFIYQSDAPYMLAYYIKKLFEKVNLQIDFSNNAKKHEEETHNIKENTRRLLEIYSYILNK